jgi:hypothetical protein
MRKKVIKIDEQGIEKLVKKILKEDTQWDDIDYDQPTEKEFQQIKKSIQNKVKHIISKVVKLQYNPEDYEYIYHINDTLNDIMENISDDYWD